MTRQSPLEDLMRRIRRRALWGLAMDQAGVSAAAGLCGAALLMVVGTQILDWYWPVALVVAGFAIGWLRVRGRVPTRYALAQRADRRLSLQDALSTAYYFSDPATTADEQVRLAQREQANRMAAGADVKVAAPLRTPRSAYVCLALAMVVGALVTVRYGLRRSLDLKQPIVDFRFDLFRNPGQQVANAKQGKPPVPQPMEGIAIPSDAPDRQANNMEAPDNQAQMKIDAPDGDQASSKDSKKGEQGATTKTADAQGEPGENSDNPSAGDQQAQRDSSSSPPNQKQGKTPSEGGNKQGQPPNENSSLMDKMRDAMANMLSRLKMQPGAGEGKKSAPSQQGAAQQASNQQNTGQKGAPSPGKPQGEGKSESEQQGEGSDQAQNSEGKSGEKSGDRQSPQEGKTGVGKQDGSKDVQQAEQSAAMGKISEILGKRAQNVTGEMMVEVASGKQQLKTPYQQRDAAHGEAGGEIHRDEVPLVYQHYVQQYFEEIRKAAPKPAASAPATAPVKQQ